MTRLGKSQAINHLPKDFALSSPVSKADLPRLASVSYHPGNESRCRDSL